LWEELIGYRIHQAVILNDNPSTMKLLKELCEIQAASGNETRMKTFLLEYVRKEKKKWKVNPEVFEGDHLQDCIVV